MAPPQQGVDGAQLERQCQECGRQLGRVQDCAADRDEAEPGHIQEEEEDRALAVAHQVECDPVQQGQAGDTGGQVEQEERPLDRRAWHEPDHRGDELVTEGSRRAFVQRVDERIMDVQARVYEGLDDRDVRPAPTVEPAEKQRPERQ